MKQQFMEDLQIIYDEVLSRQKEMGDWYALARGEHHPEGKVVLERFLEHVGLPQNSESTMASLGYIIGLREDGLEQFMRGMGMTDKQIIAKKDLAYLFVSSFYMERFENLISWIEEKALLTSFYRDIISGIHAIGGAMSRWQSRWTSHIIYGVNRELFELFQGDEEKIFEMLKDKKLLDCRDGEEADRCYSVLIPDRENGYRRVAYAEAFKKEIAEVSEALDIMISVLNGRVDEVFGQGSRWISYFKALKRAFLHTEPDELVELWADVDRCWMKITTPLQVGHPLEYYEDHYRKAVALEWDLRIVNPRLQSESKTRENIKSAAAKIAVELGLRAEKTLLKNLDQIERTQLYIGEPMLYYGAEFKGMFSAQVVPNDEKVSSEMGKKIFAYIDFVRESKKSKPVMKLSLETFGEHFIRQQRVLIEEEPELWNRIYDISTIGHEFGHILWIDSDTEVLMNKTGQFKNIEEFKATSGGLMAFFEAEDEELVKPLMDELISRAVGLMAWRKVGEVLPYYCEGLIHLELLYEAGAIGFDNGKVLIDYTAYPELKTLYTEAYLSLARHYLDKDDAAFYLGRYTEKVSGEYMPKTKDIMSFVEHYYKRYEEIGRQVADMEI